MLVSAISYFNRNSNIGVESSQSKHQSGKSNLTENFGHDKDKKIINNNSNVFKTIVTSVSTMLTKDKAEETQSRCLSIVG